MKPLLLSTHYMAGGAGRAACRLHQGLLGAGSDAHLMVQDDISGTVSRVHAPEGAVAAAAARLRPSLEMLPLVWYRKRSRLPFSVNFLPDRIATRVARLAPDLINLHWVNGGFLCMESLRRLDRPLVWTLHDSWLFTGGCHIPLDCGRYRDSCGRCPALGSDRESDLSRWVWSRKAAALAGIDLTVVTPSRWLARCAAESALLKGVRIEVIPNGLDLSRMRPVEQGEARRLLGLSAHKKLILFGAMSSTSDRNKGFHLLLPALKLLAGAGFAAGCEVVVFGGDEPADRPDFGMKGSYLGRLADEERLSLLYSAADVFVAPSLQENLPYTVMEAMACGTPCVAFNVGGIPDLIDDAENGFLAQPYQPASLAEGIARVLQGGERSVALSRAARQKIESRFSLERCTGSYLDLYRDVTGRR